MPRLKLNELQCTKTEDNLGNDEAYLRVNGSVVWGPVDINDGQNRNLTPVTPISFFGAAIVELFDQDVGGIFDPDDFLGANTISALDLNIGPRAVRFTGDEADYTLIYEVVP